MVETSDQSAPAGGASLAVPRTIALVGLMGAGKSCIGRLLATALDLPFVDADKEIEAAAGCSVEDIFAAHGVGGEDVLDRAAGGGAFMDPETRRLILDRATSVWLRADVDLLLRRTARRNNRPLLKRGDPREILARLIKERYPVYAEADVVVDSVDGPPEMTLARVLDGLRKLYGTQEFVGSARSAAQ